MNYFDAQYSRFILFFSVDLENSTQYKQKQQGLNNCKLHSWLPVFLDFYKDFPTILNKNFNSLLHRDFPIWKSAGDELLYFYYVKDLDSFLEAIYCFYNSIKEYNEKQLEKDKESLLVKGTIWCGEFPLINYIIPFEDKLDFLGPSVDIGFRLTNYSTKNKLVVSIEVAYILCSIDHEFIDIKDMFFDGEVELKGVLNNKPYPIFWLKIDDDSSFFKSQLALHNKTNIDYPVVVSYIESYVESFNDESILCLPYFFNRSTKELDFGIIPEAHYKLNADHTREIESGYRNDTYRMLSNMNREELEEVDYLEKEIENS